MYSVGTSGRDARACCNPAISSHQHGRLADLRDYHVLFAPLLWLLLRVPNVTLGVSLLLYALVHVFGWSVSAWPNNVWFFNPLAWQLLIVLGAWWVVEGEKFRPWVTSRAALILAVLYLVFSLIIALSWGIKPLEPLVPRNLTRPAFPARQIESQSVAAAAFFGSCNSSVMVCSSGSGEGYRCR